MTIVLSLLTPSMDGAGETAFTEASDLCLPQLSIPMPTTKRQHRKCIVLSNRFGLIKSPSCSGGWNPKHPRKETELRSGNEAAIEMWKDIIELYFQRNIFFESDKLVALAALAERFSTQIEESHLAGIWTGPELLSLLIWEPRGQVPTHNSQIYVAPSWSWASSSTCQVSRG